VGRVWPRHRQRGRPLNSIVRRPVQAAARFSRTWKLWLKGLGVIVLSAYFAYFPPHIEVQWIGAYLGIALGVGATFALIVNPVLSRLVASQKIDVLPIGDQLASNARKRPLASILFLLGEDGLFFVPVALIGANPLTAGIAAALYAFFHYPEYPIKHCLVKFAIVFLVAMLVLPHGLGSVVVAHVILDIVGYVAWRFLSARSAPQG
jgi:hypothetical protein